jgi:D-proline reductase (dithiol) PrdB
MSGWGVITFNLLRLRHKALAKLLTRFPSLSKRFIEAYTPWESEDVPWTAMEKPLCDSRVAIVTTSGVHNRNQEPFDMADPLGDPTFREIGDDWPLDDFKITHDYYDHTNADKDINIVFPIQRLKEFAEEGVIGQVAQTHYGFMGHIDGYHIRTLVHETAPEVASRLKTQKNDIVLLTPA